MPTFAVPDPSQATPSPDQRHLARIAMRAIAGRRPPGPATFVCVACEISWRGEEPDCWNCGRPATIPYNDSDTPQRLLLHRARSSSVRRTLP
jgi:hypothetical protein